MKPRKFFSVLLIVFSFMFYNVLYAQQEDQLTQVATIDALLAGAYDGIMNNEELLHYGDFGLGTFDKLNGEMIIYGGHIYQAKSDGSVVLNDTASTPFAVIVNFAGDEEVTLNKVDDYKTLQEVISKNIENKNLPVAVKIKGHFNHVKVRSVPAQEKPYRPLSEVVKEQEVFGYDNIDGTLIGFVLPEYFKSFNASGFHLHFLSSDKTKGGHLLDANLNNGTADFDILNKFFVYLPDENSGNFGELNLDKDRSEELDKVEK